MSVQIKFSNKINLLTDKKAAFEALLQKMFPHCQELLVEKEFDGNFSGSWVFLVQPIQPSELPVVVKIASVSLIEQEWQAYQDNIRGKWPYIAPIQGAPVSDGTFSALCYELVGEGVFRVESLRNYCLSEATTVKEVEALFSRLASVIERALRFRGKLARCRLWASYEPLLPFNLLLKPVSEVLGKPTVITPHTLPEVIKPNSYVELQGFVVAKVDLKKSNMTLNLPRDVKADRLPNNSYYVCLNFERASEMPSYKVGETIPLLQAQVLKTRNCCWQEEMEKVQPDFQLGTATLSLSDGTALPNPVAALKRLRSEYYDIEVHYIHGDMNLENILVDPQVGDMRLIDFGLARWDHVLHDFLRLETEVVTKLVTPVLVQAGLPAETMYDFYQQLHLATFDSSVSASAQPPHAALEKAFTILRTVRNMARDHGLLNRNKVAEYYDGLTLYLLGTLKFRNLNREPTDAKPWPKEVAFWGAATVRKLMAEPPKQTALARQEPCAVITSLRGEVEVKRVGCHELQSAQFGMPLQNGDVIMALENAQAKIMLKRGALLTLSASKNLTIDCRKAFDKQQFPRRLSNRLAKAIKEVVTALPRSFTLSPFESLAQSKSAIEQPILLTPRKSLISNPRPTFRWQPAGDASGYRIRVTMPDDYVWERETKENYLPYPDDEPPLQAAEYPNIVTVVRLDYPYTDDEPWLRVMEEESQAELKQAKADLAALEADEITRSYFLAQLYQQFELHSAAIEELEHLTQQQEDISPYLWQQLGDLYATVALYQNAEESYQTVLSLTDPKTEQKVEANAYAGLAHLAAVQGDREQAAHLFSMGELHSPDVGEDE